jgi:hypothetical protein
VALLRKRRLDPAAFGSRCPSLSTCGREKFFSFANALKSIYRDQGRRFQPVRINEQISGSTSLGIRDMPAKGQIERLEPRDALAENGFWRRGRDSNPRYGFRPYNGLANRRLQPLGHLSSADLVGFLPGRRERNRSLLSFCYPISQPRLFNAAPKAASIAAAASSCIPGMMWL